VTLTRANLEMAERMAENAHDSWAQKKKLELESLGRLIIIIIIITLPTFPSDLIFQPIAMETHGPLNASALNFLSEVGRRLSSVSGDSRETSFLFQRLSVIVQRFNSILIMDSFCTTDEDPDL